MKDVDFIKKCCEFAEGFEYDGDCEPAPDLVKYDIYIMQADSPKLFSGNMLYPLLLQRTIEGINKTSDWHLEYYIHRIVMGNKIEPVLRQVDIYKCNSIDEAKRKALEYVFERIDNS